MTLLSRFRWWRSEPEYTTAEYFARIEQNAWLKQKFHETYPWATKVYDPEQDYDFESWKKRLDTERMEALEQRVAALEKKNS